MNISAIISNIIHRHILSIQFWVFQKSNWVRKWKLKDCNKREATGSSRANLYSFKQIVCFILGNSVASEFYMRTFRDTLSVPSSQAGGYEEWLELRMFVRARLWRWNRQSAPKCWHTTFRRRGTTQKISCNIQTSGKYPEDIMQHSDAGEVPRRYHAAFRRRGSTQKISYNIQTPGKYPEDITQHSDAGELPRRWHVTFRTGRKFEI